MTTRRFASCGGAIRSGIAKVLVVVTLSVCPFGSALLTDVSAHADPYSACGRRPPTSSDDPCYLSWSAGGKWAVDVLRQRPYGTTPRLTADQALQICRDGVAANQPVAALAFQMGCMELLAQYEY